MKIGVIGCGDISRIYLQNMTSRFPGLEVIGCCARTFSHAEARAREFGIRAMTLDQLLRDPEIELVVNLTPPAVHFSVIEQALLAGKHVYTEKVIAPSCQEAARLAELARSRNLVLCAAPDTFLGDALQAARRTVDSGLLGTITSCHASINRQMGHFYEFLDFTCQPGGGIGYDLGIYYLTAFLSLLGPVAEVFGYTATSRPQRINEKKDSPHFGESYTVENENLMMSVLRFRSGVLGTLHFNGDAVMPENPYFTILGTKGILYLSNPDHFGGRLVLMRSGDHCCEPADVTVPIDSSGRFSDNCRGIGVAEMADAIRCGRVPRAECHMPVHAIEILDGIVASGKSGSSVPIRSVFDRPLPADDSEAWRK